MALFEVPQRAGRDNDAKLAKKVNSKSKKSTATVKGGSGIMGKISTIVALVEKHLGHYRDTSDLIQDKDNLIKYISKAIDNGVIAIDTETTGLDPLQNEIAGICIYTPDMHEAYIPLNHVSYITNEKVSGQLPIDFVREQFERLNEHNTRIIMFNAVFDIRFLKNQVGVKLKCYWDCYLAARLLNENEETNALKPLHNKYVLGGKGDAFKFDDLFKGVLFTQVPIKTGYLYAAHDPLITYELYKYQERFLYYESDCAMGDRNGMNGVSWVFFNIEMPCVDVVVEMEDNGIEFDLNYCNELSIKYNQKLNDAKNAVYTEIAKYKNAIDEYACGYHIEYDNFSGQGQTFSNTNPHKVKNIPLDDPVSIDSPKQLSILLYDIVGLDAGIDKKTKKPIRGTGVEILSSLDHPICKSILEYRKVAKLISTYIDKLPNCVNPQDGRIHCNFNQYGADTGRFSSNEPNLQNIPSHNKDIRKMFKAKSSDNVIESTENKFIVDRWCEVETPNGFVYADHIKTNDKLLVDDNIEITVNKIELVDKNQIIFYVR